MPEIEGNSVALAAGDRGALCYQNYTSTFFADTGVSEENSQVDREVLNNN